MVNEDSELSMVLPDIKEFGEFDNSMAVLLDDPRKSSIVFDVIFIPGESVISKPIESKS